MQAGPEAATRAPVANPGLNCIAYYQNATATCTVTADAPPAGGPPGGPFGNIPNFLNPQGDYDLTILAQNLTTVYVGGVDPGTGTNFLLRSVNANFIDAIQARKLVVTMEIDGAPEIQNAFVRDGVYTWYVQFPVTYQFEETQPGTDEKPPAPIATVLVLKIVRSAFGANTDGIAIAQWMTMGDEKPQM